VPARAAEAAVRGWPIVGWATVAIVAMVGAILALAGTGEHGVRMVIRATARSSVVLFVAAYVARPLRRVWRTPTSAWLLANRRQLGVSFAVSHAAHLLALVALFDWSVRRLVTESDAVTVVFGGIAYVFIALMAATSFDRTAAWLGPRRWKLLHGVGVHWIFAIFLLNFVGSAFVSAWYWPFAALVLAALALRIAGPALARRTVAAQIAAS
jgi:hypothetical protein